MSNKEFFVHSKPILRNQQLKPQNAIANTHSRQIKAMICPVKTKFQIKPSSPYSWTGSSCICTGTLDPA